MGNEELFVDIVINKYESRIKELEAENNDYINFLKCRLCGNMREHQKEVHTLVCKCGDREWYPEREEDVDMEPLARRIGELWNKTKEVQSQAVSEALSSLRTDIEKMKDGTYDNDIIITRALELIDERLKEKA